MAGVAEAAAAPADADVGEDVDGEVVTDEKRRV
jgi:hypothetical protein